MMSKEMKRDNPRFDSVWTGYKRGISRCSQIINRFNCLSPVPVVAAVIVLTYFSWTHIVVYLLAKENEREHRCFVKYNHKE